MMDLDEMKSKWAEQDRKIDESLRINRLLLSEARLNQSRSALRRVGWTTGLEAAMWAVCLLALGSLSARFSIPVAMVALYIAGMLQSLIRQIAMAGRVDYGEPISTIQKKVEALRILRIRTTQWAVLLGLVVWAPAAIVVLTAISGVDLYPYLAGPWLAANVGFGLVMIPPTLWVAKRYGGRMGRSTLGRRILRDLAGENLNAAKTFLGTLEAFERE